MRIVRWCAALLGQVSIIFQHEDKAQLSDSFQKAVLKILIVMDMKAKRCESAFDFKPSIRRLQEILQYMPGDTTQQVGQILAGLKRASQTRPTVKKDFTAGVDMIIGMALDPRDGLRFAGMQNVLQWVPIDARCLALGELTNFLHKSAYEQADLHEQPSLESLVILALHMLETIEVDNVEYYNATILSILEDHAKKAVVQLSSLEGDRAQHLANHLREVGVRLLAWLKAHQSEVSIGRGLLSGFYALSSCASASWESKAALLGNGDLLFFYKEWFQSFSGSLTAEEVEHFVYSIWSSPRAP